MQVPHDLRPASTRCEQVLPRTYTRAERVILLRSVAHELAEGESVELSLPLAEYVGYRRRLLWNVPTRGVGALLGRELRGAPPGRTFTYFRVQDVIAELEAAELLLAERSHTRFTVRRASTAPAPARIPASGVRGALAGVEWELLPLLVGLCLRIGRELELQAPRALVGAARAAGALHARRTRAGRAALRELIGWADALTPGRRGCYRRMLVELSADAGAAEETVYFALDPGEHGHAWLADDAAGQRSYRVTYPIHAESDNGTK